MAIDAPTVRAGKRHRERKQKDRFHIEDQKNDCV